MIVDVIKNKEIPFVSHFGTSNPPFSAGLPYKILQKEYNN